MKNTGIVYTSAEKTPVVLPELAGLLPPLTEEQLTVLEADIQTNGCYSPIIVDENLAIVDGHNRQALCEKHGIPYQMAVFHFDDTLEAMKWAVDTQKGRRNLDKWELGKIALKLKPEVEARAKAKQQQYHGNQYESGPPAMLPEVQTQNMETRKELAESVGIGERTMGKVIKIDEQAPQVVKDALDKKEISVNQGYNITRQVQDLPQEEQTQAAQIAVELEKAKKTLRRKDAEIDHRGKISNMFNLAFEKAVLLDPTEENIRLWVDGCRMKKEEIGDSIKDAREISGIFITIADTLEKLFPDALDAASVTLDEESEEDSTESAETEEAANV